jgi:hypothetical protein
METAFRILPWLVYCDVLWCFRGFPKYLSLKKGCFGSVCLVRVWRAGVRREIGGWKCKGKG